MFFMGHQEGIYKPFTSHLQATYKPEPAKGSDAAQMVGVQTASVCTLSQKPAAQFFFNTGARWLLSI